MLLRKSSRNHQVKSVKIKCGELDQIYYHLRLKISYYSGT